MRYNFIKNLDSVKDKFALLQKDKLENISSVDERSPIEVFKILQAKGGVSTIKLEHKNRINMNMENRMISKLNLLINKSIYEMINKGLPDEVITRSLIEILDRFDLQISKQIKKISERVEFNVSINTLFTGQKEGYSSKLIENEIISRILNDNTLVVTIELKSNDKLTKSGLYVIGQLGEFKGDHVMTVIGTKSIDGKLTHIILRNSWDTHPEIIIPVKAFHQRVSYISAVNFSIK